MEQQRRMLIVDDDDAILKAWQGFFDATGWHVRTAGSEDEALEIFQPGQFHAVLIDLCLPGARKMGVPLPTPYDAGLRILNSMRRQDADICLLPITAYPTTTNMNRAAVNGADGFLTKPVMEDVLDGVINRVLKRIEYLRELVERAARLEDKAKPQEENSPSCQRRILIVDDDQYIREAWMGFFQASEWEVVTAANEAEALEVFSPNQCDVAIVDLVIPPKSNILPNGNNIFAAGLRVVEAIRKADAFVGVVVVTAFGAEVHVNQAAELGTDLFIHKPIIPEWIEALVDRIGKRVNRIRSLRSFLDTSP